MTSRFTLPAIVDNPDGWGPISRPTAFKEVPFSPFNKADRLQISDWNQNQNRFKAGSRAQFAGTGAFKLDGEGLDEEDSFTAVNTIPKPKLKFARKPKRAFFQFDPKKRFNNNNNNFRGRRKGRNAFQQYNRRRWGQQDPKEASVVIDETWENMQTWELSELAAHRSSVPEGVTLVECGTLEEYSSAWDRVTPRNFKSLHRFENHQHFNVTTSDDPVIQELAAQKKGNVFGTDTILGLLMASSRSVNSWDIVVRKQNGVIFFDKRRDSRIDYLTVNENWNELTQQEKDSINHPANLSLEATLIGHNFSQQVLDKGTSRQLARPNPFLNSLEKNNEPAGGAYFYRSFDLGNGVVVVARCTVNACLKPSKEAKPALVTVRAINEFDSRMSNNVDWRQKLETQSGTLLAAEFKNNSCKMVRWTAETMLAGTDELRLGFVSRVHPKEAYKHVVLMCKRYKPQSFATSLRVSYANLWGVLKEIIETVRTLEDGDYMLQKDPNDTKLHLFSAPGQNPEEAGEDGQEDGDGQIEDEGDGEDD